MPKVAKKVRKQKAAGQGLNYFKYRPKQASNNNQGSEDIPSTSVLTQRDDPAHAESVVFYTSLADVPSDPLDEIRKLESRLENREAASRLERRNKLELEAKLLRARDRETRLKRERSTYLTEAQDLRLENATLVKSHDKQVSGLKAKAANIEFARRVAEREVKQLNAERTRIQNKLSSLRELNVSISDQTTALRHQLHTYHLETSRLSEKLEKSESLSTTYLDVIAQKEAAVERLILERDSLQMQLDESTSALERAQHGHKCVQDELRAGREMFRKRWERADERGNKLQLMYDGIREWDSRAGNKGAYTQDARWLMRQLVRAGCAEDKVGFAILCCASVLGVSVRALPSARMVNRAVREGGAFSLMQLGYEISHSNAIGLSTDVTSHRGITIEGRHVTLQAPKYRDASDDELQWVTRSIGAEKALDHTAERQLSGMHRTLDGIAGLYTQSPLAHRNNDKLTLDGAVSKTKFMNMDHAADGKKYHRQFGDGKRDAAVREFGRKKLEALTPVEFVEEMCRVSDEDLEAVLVSIDVCRPVSQEDRARAILLVLRTRFGELEYSQLEGENKDFADLFLFGGCCGHKDLNACKRAGDGMQADWLKRDAAERPVLLPNSDNDDAIRAGGVAMKKALQKSDGGAIKATEILGLLFRGKPGGKLGYQDVYKTFMMRRRAEIFGLNHPLAKFVKDFPNTPACRYQAHTYAAAEIVAWGDLCKELILEVCQKKGKSGKQNHLESNALKALNCKATLAELCVLTVYGILVSWQYLSLTRSHNDGAPVNLLDLVDLHRRLPIHCTRLAVLFDVIFSKEPCEPYGPARFLWADLTIDGKPPSTGNLHLLDKICKFYSSGAIPDFKWCFQSFMRHAAKGWTDFGEEFRRGGPIDSLPKAIRKLIFIPATNDVNEGILGAWRVATRFQPNISPENFTARHNCSRNETEDFIISKCNEDDAQYVRQFVRKADQRRVNQTFAVEFSKEQARKAAESAEKAEQGAQRKRDTLAMLAAKGLERDPKIVEQMSIEALKIQFRIYKLIVQDPVILELQITKLKKSRLQAAVLDALRRCTPGMIEADHEETEGTGIPAKVEPEEIVDELEDVDRLEEDTHMEES